MANTPTHDDKDRQDAEQLARLYRAGTRAEPPARLDERILAEANRSTGSGTKRGPGPFGWGAPLSLAAVVVLSVTVVLLLTREDIDPHPVETATLARPVTESVPTDAAESKQERRAEAPAAFPHELRARKITPVPPARVAREAPAARLPTTEAMPPSAGATSPGLSATSTRDDLAGFCNEALRRLARFPGAQVRQQANAHFEYEGKNYTGCVGVIDGDRGRLPPDLDVGHGFYPQPGSDLAAMGWRASKEADGPDGTFYQVNRGDVFCAVDGQWDGGDDSDANYVPDTKLRITVQCAHTR